VTRRERKSLSRKAESKTAVAYLHTSSAANVGADKDSEKRQREAITAFAKRAGYEIVDWFSDAAVSGEDEIGDRSGFSAMLDRIEDNGVRVVLVEDASRFARKVLTQELGIVALLSRGVTVWSARGEINLTETDDEFKIAMRQIAAVFAELEKRRLVKKLKAARDRKRATGKKVEGRKSHAQERPEIVTLAKRLHRANPKTGKRRSLREISAELAAAGHLNQNGRPFHPKSVQAMLSR
jgi:DNA invertase Pin-like site-specific DNA recombinase